MKKKTWIVAIILIAMVATMAIGFTACGTNLDGVYKNGTTNFLRISGNKIERISYLGEKNEIMHGTTTFTKEKDKLVLAGGKLESIIEITIKDKETIVTTSLNGLGKEIVNEYKKVVDKK